ncbi:MAG: RNA polymerase Rpb1 domain 5 [Candidatus Parvarchaeum acidiphilum ARMAN-4]|uniref:DNA-directed RNA polymerase n=1 Tax=Candidatus Parvarchaeum acidiphilum ARMAN-4 TaxID=662760 RepID=D2EG03_PARA4|nr:MAG: RNA polymerase Rpb1 domain 5 [Candidatus Parvarchaeum acidiphilum ARMAN-4]
MKIEIPEKYIIAFKEKYGEDADLAELEKIYLRSLVTPGEAVGVIAAQSIGEASTQLTLRTKHAAGLSVINTTTGLPRLVEIFDSKKDISTPFMDIYLKPEYASSKQKASEVANKLIEINIEDITHSYTVSLRKKLIEFILDKELLKEYGFTPKDILAKLSKLKVSASIEKDSLIIVDKSADSVKKLIRLRNKIVEINLSGLPGVSRAILNQNSQGNYWIKTIGTNLSEVLKMEEIDQKNTVSNDIIEVSKVLGIEAARNLIIEEVNATLQNVGLTVDLRHIFLIADAMCLDGAVRGIGRYGLSGEADSVLARASFEVPLKHLIEAGMYHESDPFKYVANDIMSNQVIPIGTGRVELVVKENGKGNSEEDSGKDKK